MSTRVTKLHDRNALYMCFNALISQHERSFVFQFDSLSLRYIANYIIIFKIKSSYENSDDTSPPITKRENRVLLVFFSVCIP